MLTKSVKNDVESQAMIESHIRDAVALCKFAAHLEEEVLNGSEDWTELSASKLLSDYRSEQLHNTGW